MSSTTKVLYSEGNCLLVHYDNGIVISCPIERVGTIKHSIADVYIIEISGENTDINIGVSSTKDKEVFEELKERNEK